MKKELPKLIRKEDIFSVVPKKIMKELIKSFKLNINSGFHGYSHWARVLENGLIIASMNGANKKVIIAFSFFHDICRENEEKDPEHGPRGAEALMLYKNDLGLTDEEIKLAFEACYNHTNVIHSDNLTIGTCWDADRLDLMRVGIYPDVKYLNTQIAKEPALIVICNKKALDFVTPNWAIELFNEL